MATITASAAGGKWSEAGAWEGGVEPKVGDDVILGAGSGSITIEAEAKCRSLDATNYKKTLTINKLLAIGTTTSNAGLCLKFGSGMTLAGAEKIQFVSTSGTVEKITTAGKKVVRFTFQSAAGKFEFMDKYEASEIIEVRGSASCELKTGGQEVVVPKITVLSGNVLSLGASKVVLNTASGVAWKCEGTINAETSTIELTGTGATLKEFLGNGKTYNIVTLTAAENVEISGANTFATLNINTAGKATATKFKQGETQTVTTLTTNGTTTELVLIESSLAGSQFKLTKAAGTVALEFIKIKDSKVEGGATWTLKHANDEGNNTGWTWEATTIEASVAGGNWNTTAAWVGAIIPMMSDDALLAAASGTITITNGAACRSLEATNYKATLNGGQELTIGNSTNNAGLAVKLGTGMTLANETNMRFKFASTSGVLQAITCAGRKMCRFNFISGKYQLEDKYERHAAEGANIVVETGTEFKTNGQEVICWLVTVKGTGILSLGATKMKVEASGGSIFTVETGSTFEAGTSTVELTSTEPVNIEGPTAGLTFNMLTLAGQVTLATGNITYTVATLNLNMAGSENGFRVGNGATLEITTSLTTNAKAGSILKIRSSSVGNKWKLKKTGTPIAIGEYIELRDCVAEGAVPFTTTLNDKNLGGNQNFTWPQEEYVPPPSQPPTFYSPRRLYKPFPPPAPVEAPTAKEILETLTATQGQGVTLERTVQRTLTVAQAQSILKVAQPARTVSAGQGQSATRTTALARAFTVTQGQAATRTTALARTLSATQPQALVRIVEPARILSSTQAQSASRTAALTRTLSATQAQSASRSSALARTLTATQAQVVSKTTAKAELLTVGQGQAASRTATPTRNLSVGQGTGISRTTQLGRELAVTQATASSVARGLGRTLSVGQGQAAGVSSQIDRKLVLGQGQAVTRTTSVARTLAATQAQAISRAAALTRSLSCGGSQAVTIAHGHAIARNLTIEQGQATSVAHSLTRSLAVAQASSPTIARSMTRTLVAGGSQAARLTRGISRMLSAAQSSTATVRGGVTVVFSLAQATTVVRATQLGRTISIGQGQLATVVVHVPFHPAKLISSTVTATLTSGVESSDIASSAEVPVLTSSTESTDIASTVSSLDIESSVD